MRIRKHYYEHRSDRNINCSPLSPNELAFIISSDSEKELATIILDRNTAIRFVKSIRIEINNMQDESYWTATDGQKITFKGGDK